MHTPLTFLSLICIIIVPSASGLILGSSSPEIRLTKEEFAARCQGYEEGFCQELWDRLNDAGTRGELHHPLPSSSSRFSPATASFDMVNLLYYAGAVTVMLSMGVFIGVCWKQFGSGFMAFIALVYAVVFTAVGWYMWERTTGGRDEYYVLGGLCFTVAVHMTPLFIYGVMSPWLHGGGSYSDFYMFVRSEYVWIEIGTMIVGFAYLRYAAFPFLLFPVAVSFWFFSMDLGMAIWERLQSTRSSRSRTNDPYRRLIKARTSMAVGVLMLLIARHVQWKHQDPNMGWWLDLFGALAFHGGFGYNWLLFWSRSVPFGEAVIIVLVSVAELFASVLLDRGIFAVLGGITLWWYVTYLAAKHTQDLMFPFALSAVGIATMYAGYLWCTHRDAFALLVQDQLVLYLRQR